MRVALVTGEADDLENVAVGVVKIGAWPVHGTALAILLEEHVDAIGGKIFLRVLVMKA